MFMAIPCYAYLKLKIQGPNGVITVSSNFERSRECEMANIALAEDEIAAVEFIELRKTADLDGVSLSKKSKLTSAF